ncbi:Protein-tyrosine phosphatase, low molecular weight [Rhodopirellula maiorica SM1]|uniref:Protein-tyrosine phosphatase, low molecular weight n=1 Tax=Rhodopirellula maiorica SM1 TaxID=1265738 RepID=M5S0D4_9BACT|nr:arsenate reductase ArsC [Rhodopirellula maiorica]EMI19629.1 Protein-tyrosine phosphatase, low molecular weight [Rhodopirellula maiorica SM1]
MTKPVVLFLCEGNSARSQMAEAFLRKHAGNRFEVHSAGLNPRDIHPFTVRVMDEVGISIEGHRSKPLTEYLGKIAVRYVIIVCEFDESACPHVWPFTRQTIRWPFDDPAAAEGTEHEKLEQFRTVRNAIEEHIIQWVHRGDMESEEPRLP